MTLSMDIQETNQVARKRPSETTLARLKRALENDDPDTLLSLLDAAGNGLDVHYEDDAGCSLVYLATLDGAIRCIDHLVAAGASADSTRRYEHLAEAQPSEPMHVALSKCRFAIAERLLDAGANSKAQDHDGNTALHIIATRTYFGDEAQVRALREQALDLIGKFVAAGCPVDQRNAKGTTALLRAVVLDEEALPTVGKLLDVGADPNIVGSSGRCALHYASEDDNLPLIRLLASAGADVNAMNEKGQTPLMSVHSVSAAEVLFGYGARIGQVDSGGRDAFHNYFLQRVPRTLEAHNQEVLLYLLQQGANPTLPDCNGRTALDILESPANERNPVAETLRIAIKAQGARSAMRSAIGNRAGAPRP
jgi:ankyrin repeat protein